MCNSADIFTSRRTHFNECTYWCRSEEDIAREIDLTTMVYVDHDLNELFYERSPNGTFMAVETTDYDHSNQIIGGTMMFDQSFVTIYTNDYINDLKVNDIVYFDEYDIKEHLKAGRNTIGIMLGNGFQNCWGGFPWKLDEARFASAPKFSVRIEIAYSDNSSFEFEADESCKCHASPIYADDIRYGECYDANLEIENWKFVKLEV